MTLPPWTSARIAISGLRAAIVGAAFILLLGAFAVQTVRLEGLKVWPFEVTGWIAKAKAREAERDAERTAHQTTKDEYRAAQAQAALLEAARLKRVRQQQEEITNAIEKDYRGQLADLGARAEPVRPQVSEAPRFATPPAELMERPAIIDFLPPEESLPASGPSTAPPKSSSSETSSPHSRPSSSTR